MADPLTERAAALADEAGYDLEPWQVAHLERMLVDYDRQRAAAVLAFTGRRVAPVDRGLALPVLWVDVDAELAGP